MKPIDPAIVDDCTEALELVFQERTWDLDKSIVEVVLQSLLPSQLLSLLERVMPGWQMVPREPTPQMVDSTFEHWNAHSKPESHNTRNKRVYAAMLAAAPKPEKQG